MQPENCECFRSEHANQMIVGPLARKIAQEAYKLDRALDSIRIEFCTNLDLAKREILDRIREVETSVETMAREIAHRKRESEGNEDNRD